MQTDSFFTRVATMFEIGWTAALEKLIAILPQIFVAILIIAVGWVAATLIRMMLLRILSFFAVDKLAAKTNLERILKSIGFKRSVSHIFGSLFFWIIILFTLVTASEALELTQVADALGVVTSYIPKVIAAFLIIVFGMLLAKFLQTFVTQAIGNTELGYERPIGKAVNIIVIVFVLIAALEQLQIQLSVVTTNFMILLVSIIAIAGVTFAIGARRLLENFIACQHLKSLLMEGDTIHIEKHSGTVKGFTQTSVILEEEGHDAILPATLFFDQPYTRTRA